MLNVSVLNLKQRIDRRTNFQRWNRQQGIQYEFVDAIDGRRLQFTNLVEQGLAAADLQHYSAGALGCALSHRGLWQQCVSENRPFLVCEDDAVLRADFETSLPQLLAQLPPDWDFGLLGYNFNSATSFELFPGMMMHSLFSHKVLAERDLIAFTEVQTIPTYLPLHHAFGTCAYAISPKGASQLIDRCFPLANRSVFVPGLGRSIVSFGIDSLLNTLYSELSAFCAVPPLALSPNDRQDSDISN